MTDVDPGAEVRKAEMLQSQGLDTPSNLEQPRPFLSNFFTLLTGAVLVAFIIGLLTTVSAESPDEGELEVEIATVADPLSHPAYVSPEVTRAAEKAAADEFLRSIGYAGKLGIE